MADRTIPQLYTDNPITIGAGVKIPASDASNVAGAIDADVLLTTAAGEINALTAKSPAVGADKIVIEDSAASWAKKSVLISAVNGCAMACSTARTNFTPTGSTIDGHFAGIDTKLAGGVNSFVAVNGSGDATVPNDLDVTTDFRVNTNKFTVAGATGNTLAAGTLDVTGNFAVNTNKATISATDGSFNINSGVAAINGTTGNITTSGTVDGRDVAADGTKLDTIETNADVTDAANVAAAGAAMAAATIADNVLVRGDGGTRGVQATGITVDDSDNLTMPVATVMFAPIVRSGAFTNKPASGVGGNGTSVEINGVDGAAGDGGTAAGDGGDININAGWGGSDGGGGGGDGGDVIIDAGERTGSATVGALKLQTVGSGGIASGNGGATAWTHSGSFAVTSVRALGTSTFAISGADAGKVCNWTGTSTGVAGTVDQGTVGQVTTIVLSGTAGTITFAAGSGVTLECEEGKTLTTNAPGASTVVTVSIIYISATFAIVTGGLA